MTTKALAADAGCWIDGHWGQYGICQVVRIAQEWDYGLSPNDQDAVVAYLAGDGDLDIVVELADEAEAWMNENIAPDGYSFGWHDGEFFLQSTEWWSE